MPERESRIPLTEVSSVPQPRLHKNAAARQAAYRQRKDRHLAKQAELATLARNLHAIVQMAVMRSAFPLPAGLAEATPNMTLGNLIQFLDPLGKPGHQHSLTGDDIDCGTSINLDAPL